MRVMVPVGRVMVSLVPYAPVGVQSVLVVAWSLMFPMASEREQEELVVVSSLPVATVKEAACVG